MELFAFFLLGAWGTLCVGALLWNWFFRWL